MVSRILFSFFDRGILGADEAPISILPRVGARRRLSQQSPVAERASDRSRGSEDVGEVGVDVAAVEVVLQLERRRSSDEDGASEHGVSPQPTCWIWSCAIC